MEEIKRFKDFIYNGDPTNRQYYSLKRGHYTCTNVIGQEGVHCTLSAIILYKHPTSHLQIEEQVKLFDLSEDIWVKNL